jgi:hypothetical protein
MLHEHERGRIDRGHCRRHLEIAAPRFLPDAAPLTTLNEAVLPVTATSDPIPACSAAVSDGLMSLRELASELDVSVYTLRGADGPVGRRVWHSRRVRSAGAASDPHRGRGLSAAILRSTRAMGQPSVGVDRPDSNPSRLLRSAKEASTSPAPDPDAACGSHWRRTGISTIDETSNRTGRETPMM